MPRLRRPGAGLSEIDVGLDLGPAPLARCVVGEVVLHDDLIGPVVEPEVEHGVRFRPGVVREALAEGARRLLVAVDRALRVVGPDVGVRTDRTRAAGRVVRHHLVVLGAVGRQCLRQPRAAARVPDVLIDLNSLRGGTTGSGVDPREVRCVRGSTHEPFVLLVVHEYEAALAELFRFGNTISAEATTMTATQTMKMRRPTTTRPLIAFTPPPRRSAPQLPDVHYGWCAQDDRIRVCPVLVDVPSDIG